MKEGFGPILFKEECTFLKEIKIGQSLRLNLKRGTISPDGRKWTLHQEFLNEDGAKLAHLTVQGAWMDLRERKLRVPPESILEGFNKLTEGAEFSYGS